MKIEPQPGPQFRFLSNPAQIAIYGGAAGSGKTFALTVEPLRHVDKPGFSAIFFRRTSPELTGGGSVWEESRTPYLIAGGTPREHRLDWHWPTGAMVEFSHLQYVKDVYSHQSKQYTLICFDELTHFEETQFWYLLSRNRSTCGVKPYIRAATNPDPDSWVRRFIDWWIDDETGYPIESRSGKLRWFVRVGGELKWADTPEDLSFRHPGAHKPISVTFIPAKLTDNPALTKKDPGYSARLEALPPVERERLKLGNWNIKPSAGNVFRRDWFEVVQAAPVDPMISVRAWDRAATRPSQKNPDPDWTAGVKMLRSKDDLLFVDNAIRLQDTAFAVDTAIKNAATSDTTKTTVALWQDPGQAGKKDVEDMTRKLMGYTVHTEVASKNKLTYANPVSSQAQAGNIKLVDGPWVDAFLRELESFPDGKHDDQVDALSLAFLVCGDNDLAVFRALTTL